MTFLSRIRENDGRWLWKFALRSIAIIFSIVTIGLAGSAYRRLKYGENGYGFAFMRLAWLFIPLFFSLFWNFTSLAITIVRGNWIHPGVDVGCDLVLFILLGSTSGISLGRTIDKYSQWYWTGGYYPPSYTVFPNGTIYYSKVPPNSCEPFSSCAAEAAAKDKWHRASIEVIVACAFALILMFIHFALFLSACIRTHRRRLEYIRNKPTKDQKAQNIARAMIAQMTENGQLAPIQRPTLETDPAQQAPNTRNSSPHSQATASSPYSGHPAVPPEIHVSPSS